MPNPAFPPLPAHLAEKIARGLVAGEPIAQFELGPGKNFVYLLIDWPTRKAALVDPQTDIATPLQALAAHGITLERVLLTHTHFDHVAGLGALAAKYPKISTHVHGDDAHRLSREWLAQLTLVPAEDGKSIPVGAARLRVLHTPGHSAGECSYFWEADGKRPPYLFTGDTVFIRDCGRTDFESGSNEQMFESLQKIAKLPAETVILVGHHYQAECASTLGRERVESPPFRCRSVEELKNLP